MRILLKVASSLLILLGLLISVAAAANAISDAHQTPSPFDQVDAPTQLSEGFDPMIVSKVQPVDIQAAPTLPPETSDLKVGKQITSAASEIPTSPPIPWLDPEVVISPLPTATPMPVWIPDRIVIPAILLDAPVIPATVKDIIYQEKPYQQWVAPDSFSAGLLTTSASLGVTGNTVLIGHHNIYGEVFRYLVDLKVGDLILVYSGDKAFTYIIAQKLILPERYQPIEVRLKNALWIAPSQDERLTLVTCWPYDSNTHRLIIVAKPVSSGPLNMTR